MPENPISDLPENSPGFSPDAQRRIQEKAATLASRLKGCSKTDLELLVRYYIYGEDARSIAERMKIDPARISTLRSRLRKPVGSASHRVKSAAAGGFSGY